LDRAAVITMSDACAMVLRSMPAGSVVTKHVESNFANHLFPQSGRTT